jgi:hypothetical protein
MTLFQQLRKILKFQTVGAFTLVQCFSTQIAPRPLILPQPGRGIKIALLSCPILPAYLASFQKHRTWKCSKCTVFGNFFVSVKCTLYLQQWNDHWSFIVVGSRPQIYIINRVSYRPLDIIRGVRLKFSLCFFSKHFRSLVEKLCIAMSTIK